MKSASEWWLGLEGIWGPILSPRVVVLENKSSGKDPQ